jgi:hypothetical protein
VEINGAIRDVLELTRDEVTKSGAYVFESLRRDGKRVMAKCPFMCSYAARHPEYAPLLEGLSKTGGTHARTALLDDDIPAYRMHDQR